MFLQQGASVCTYLKCVHFSVIKEHEDGHLEGGHLQNVLAGVKTCHLSTSHTHFRTVLLQMIGWTIAHEEAAFRIPNHLLFSTGPLFRRLMVKRAFAFTILTVP